MMKLLPKMDVNGAETTSSLNPPHGHGGRCSSASETDLPDECKKGSGVGPESAGLPLNTRRVKCYSVHVGNLPASVSRHDLTELFKGVGPVHEVYIAPLADAKVTYGFVRYLDPQHCARAIKDLNRWYIRDQQLRVELARETTLDRSARPMIRHDRNKREKLNQKKNPDDDEIMWKVKQRSLMSDINLPLFMKEVKKADSNLTPLIRFELPRVTLDLDDFDEAFGLSPPSTPDPLKSVSQKHECQTEQFAEPVKRSPSARLPKTTGLTNIAMNSEMPSQPQARVNSDRFQLQPSVHSGGYQTSVLSGTGASVKVLQHSFIDRENLCLLPQQAASNPLVQSPPLPKLQQPFVISSSQTTVSGEQSVNVTSLNASSVPLSTRYQPLQSQHPGLDNYAPGVYELDEHETDVSRVFAEKSPTGLKCTLTPKGSRIVTNSSSPELGEPSGLQCTLTPAGTRTVTKANNSKLTTGPLNLRDSSFETSFSQLPESIQELNLSPLVKIDSVANDDSSQSAASNSPQTNTNAPIGRGRGILAFQNMFRPVGGTSKPRRVPILSSL
ncbi:uncharacterized protein LOC135492270 [Lineus longissimus]|uniref:uncharacterized protein LOC135492270 n=1 Tax=Lineus longissimus TaxID=88925 RepID=UPI00315D9BBD